MKTFLIVFFVLHGLIHLLGFIKAFFPAATAALSRDISGPAGLLWLLCTVLFLWALSGYVLKKEWWPLVAFIAVGVSQVLISFNWEDAKYGTVANLLVFLIALFSYSQIHFRETVTKEVSTLFFRASLYYNNRNTQQDPTPIPAVVQHWLNTCGVGENYYLKSVRLKQHGEMRTTPGGKWMPFNAVQYYDVQDPAFIWITRVKLLPFIFLDGRDKLLDGEGQMLIRAASIFKLVDQGMSDRINSASMLRYLAEMCWFPAAARNPYINWKAEEPNSARATFTYEDKSVSGLFKFSKTGEVISFEAFRYMSNKKGAKKELWVVEVLENRIYNGVRVPARCKVSWKLAEGIFTWLNLEITDMEYNVTAPYGRDYMAGSFCVSRA